MVRTVTPGLRLTDFLGTRYIAEARPELAIVVEMEVYDDLRNGGTQATLIPLRKGELPA